MLSKSICIVLIALFILAKYKEIIKHPEQLKAEPINHYSQIHDNMLQLEDLRKRLDSIEDMITKIESNEAGIDATAMELYMHDVGKLQLIVDNNSSILTALYDERTATRSAITETINTLYVVTKTVTKTSRKKENHCGRGEAI